MGCCGSKNVAVRQIGAAAAPAEEVAAAPTAPRQERVVVAEEGGEGAEPGLDLGAMLEQSWCNALREKCLTKCVSCKHGSGDKVTLAITQDDITPAWLSNVLDCRSGQAVKRFRTKLCDQGQVGVTVLLLDIEYVRIQNLAAAPLPKSLAVKMHGPGTEQRKNAAGTSLYSTEIFAYHDFDVAKSVPEVFGIWYDARHSYEKIELFNLVLEDNADSR